MRSSLFIVSTVMLITTPSFSHVVLENPKPFKPAEYGPSNPITETTYPCKAPPGARLEIDGSPTEMAIGDDQLLTFHGQAVHGGGSCQISLTSDIDEGFQPSKDSRFFVIHSIEGGCPARNQTGNLDGPNTDRYYFKIPAGVDPGNYVLSWTWVPRIGGGPEYYMNCAPVVVTDTKAKPGRLSLAERRETSLARREDFPDLWMADLGDLTGTCTNAEALEQQVAISYPNPGNYVDRPDADEQLFPQPCDGNPRAGGGSGSSSGMSSHVVSLATSATSLPQRTTAASSTVLTISLPDSSSSSTVPITITTASSIVLASTSATTRSSASDLLSIVPIDTTKVTSIPTASSVPASSEIPVGGDSACQEGYLMCVDGTQFSTCTGGRWTSPQPLAPGTTCTGNVGMGLEIIQPQ